MSIKRVWIDVDPAIGVPGRDLDDALALFLLLASPEIHLEGVSVNFGNVPMPRGLSIAHEVIGVAGAEVPIHAGARSRHDLGKETPASRALVEAVRRAPGEISLLAVAPLTNVATAMALDPSFAGGLRELVVMGGALAMAPFSFFGEFNLHLDGPAADRVLRAPIPKTLLTMDLCAQAVFTPLHLRRVQELDTRVGRYLARHIPSWMRVARLLFRRGGFIPWDPVAAAYMIVPNLFDRRLVHLEVRPSGLRSGSLRSVREVHPSEAESPSAVDVPTKLDGAAFMELMLSRLGRLP